MTVKELPFDIASLHTAYAAGLGAREIGREVLRRVEAAADTGIFISFLPEDEIDAQAQRLGPFDPVTKPLWGIPFAVKDNIDVAGMETTAACPAFAYRADADAACVAAIRAAGAVVIGKTNLDQFATGLVGIRTPYPAPRNAIDDRLLPGGSSSGSAVAVARGLVSFALGTDTAGSGRVPAAFNGIVGLKPTPGAISMTGVVPACRTIDTVSVFALNVADAYAAYSVCAGIEGGDPFAHPVARRPLGSVPPSLRIGVPSPTSRRFFGDELQAQAYGRALDDLEGLGAEIVEVDFAPFYDIAAMLYDGPWLAERLAAIERMLALAPDAVHRVTRQVICGGSRFSAVDTFRGMYRLQGLRRQIEPLLATLDALCVPSIPRLYTVADVEADPLTPNTRLGTYTNFVNLLGMCGCTVPARRRGDGLPASVTILACAGRDAEAAAIAQALHYRIGTGTGTGTGATGWPLPELQPVAARGLREEIEIAVVGAHMSGPPLNGELRERKARYLRRARTARCYRLYALAGGPPVRPGLVRHSDGREIELEVWALPREHLAGFIEGIPHPLGIGTIALESGESVKGFVCESSGLEGAIDITHFGGWRAFLAARHNAASVSVPD